MARSAAPAGDLAGSKLGHFELVEAIGQGGMGEVYRAWDPKLERFVAVKVLLGPRAADPQWRRRLEQEAKTAAALNHPNICTIYGFGSHTDPRFIAMELVEGRTLDQLLERGPLKFDRVFRLSLELTDALAAAHGVGIVHRDLKPANVFVTKRGHAKVVDFGLATLTCPAAAERDPDTERTLSNPEGLAGTIAYMSPEQARGEDVDARSDVHALGAVLWEMATGRAAFRGKSIPLLFDAILNRRPLSATRVNPDVPRSFSRIVAKALAKDPEARHASAAELHDELCRLDRRPRRGRSRATSRPAKRARPSLAVLPFRNLVADPLYDVFAEGLHDEIVTALAGVRSLRVAPRSSTHAAGKKGGDLRAIAGRLGVDHILEGTIRRGTNLRITLRLLDASRDDHSWSRRFDCALERPPQPVPNVLAMVERRRMLEARWTEIQDEIAAEVADAVRGEFGADP